MPNFSEMDRTEGYDKSDGENTSDSGPSNNSSIFKANIINGDIERESIL